MNLTTMSVVELKALAYDVVAGIEQGQNNLRLINQEIAKKSEPQKEVPVEEVVKKK